MSPTPTTRNAILRFGKWAWTPLPALLLLIIGLRVTDIRENHESLALLGILDAVFAVGCSCLAAHRFSLRFLEHPAPGWLLIGSGAAVWGVMSLVGIVTDFPLGGQEEPDINLNVTMRNTCVWIAAFFQLAGAGFLSMTARPLSSPRRWLIAEALVVLGAVGFVLFSTLSGWMPLFFVQGEGGTQARQFVLSSAISMFVVAAMLVRPRPAQKFSAFAQWYCHAMLLFALGLAALMADSVRGSLLCWSGRMAQFLGSAYLLAAAISTSEGPGTPKFRGEPGIQKWRQDAVAIVLAMAAGAVRLAFLDELGNRAAYLTFFPAVMLAALYGGLRSGLISAAASAGLALYFWVEPEGSFLIVDQADAIELAAFIIGSFITSWVAESMYQAHARAATAEERARHADDLLQAQEQRQRLMSDLSERVGELQAILDAVPVGVWISHDPQCRRITGNAYADRIIMKTARGDNVSASALPGEAAVSYKVFHHGVETAPEELPAQAAARTGTPVDDMELELLFADGRRVHLLSSAVPLFDSLGRVRGAINTGVDLTEIKKAQEKVRKSEAMLSRAQQMANIGSWEWNIQSGELIWSDQVYKIFGLRHGEVTPSYKLFLETINPADRAYVKLATEHALEGAPYSTEYSVTHGDGTVRHVLANADVDFDGEGRPVRMIGTMLDITDRKQAAEVLRKSEEKYRSIFENSLDAIFLTLPDGTVTSANRAAGAMFRLAPQEIRHLHLRSLLDPADRRTNLALAERDATGRMNCELMCLRRDGTRFCAEVSSVIIDRNVQPSFVIVRDIDARKQAEEARRITLDFLHLINRCTSQRELIRAAIGFFRDCSKCDAVGVRLKAEFDFPYYETWGFSPAFLEQEQSLLLRDAKGCPVRDECGAVRLACLCGKLLEIGKNGPIPRHSHWTNDAAELAARLSGDQRVSLRGRCLTEGYRSIALIPMEQAGNAIGLIQLNAFEKGRFSPEQIALYEHLATQLSVALAKIQAEEELQKAHDELEQRVRDRTEALRRSTEILHIIAKNLPNGAIYQFERTADGRERYNYLSDGIRQLRGSPDAGAPETPETPGMLHAMIHPDDAARIAAAEEESARSLTPLDIQGRIRTAGGEIKWLRWHSAPRRLDDGGTLWDGIIVDVTAIKESEAALQRANRALLVLKECDEALVRATEETELLHRVCSILVEVGGAKMAWVGFAENDEQKSVRPVASAGECGDYLEAARIVWADVPRGRGPTGTAIRNRIATACHNTQDDPILEPWRARQQALGYAASIALPLIWENQCLGALMIYSPEADAFNAPENELLLQLAGDLAYGIMALRIRTERLQLQRDLLTISEREKQVISQELHDGLCQSLAGTAMMGYALQRRLAEGRNPEADCAKEIFGMLNTAVNEARNIAHGLHPVGPKPEGLMEALAQFSTSVSNLFEIECAFECPAPVLLESETAATHLFRITQEAVSNARKHGEAEKIVIRLQENGGRIVLTIRDDGVGIPDNLPQKRGLGLNTMNHRANQIGATLCVQRAGTRGTIVCCEASKKALNSLHAPANG